jgi:hypothetical protein
VSSCCRASQKDPNLEFFEAIDKLTASISNREVQDISEDAGSNVRWPKYQRLAQELRRIEQITGKKL